FEAAAGDCRRLFHVRRAEGATTDPLEFPMSIDALRDLIPAYGKDISLNLSSLANETVLNDQQKWGCFLASAHAIGVAPVVKAIEAQAATVLSPEAMNAAKAAAAI